MASRNHIPTLQTHMRTCALSPLAVALLYCLLAFANTAATAQSDPSPSATSNRVLDRAIAVVNNQVLLKSDLDQEMRIDRLLPATGKIDSSQQKTLDRMITRTLIEQQIIGEDPHGLDVAPEELDKSLKELRESLPACRHRDCTTAAGWAEYLKTLTLTPDEVESYWVNRIAVLRFIEQRFRSGIRITPEEIEKYYRETLVPLYAKPEDAPKQTAVEARIQEILLQQRVNSMLNDWLKSLKDQGQVEILDPSLQATESKTATQPPTAPNIGEGSAH